MNTDMKNYREFIKSFESHCSKKNIMFKGLPEWSEFIDSEHFKFTITFIEKRPKHGVHYKNYIKEYDWFEINKGINIYGLDMVVGSCVFGVNQHLNAY
jgi:diaminopimelate decarboxylase